MACPICHALGEFDIYPPFFDPKVKRSKAEVTQLSSSLQSLVCMTIRLVIFLARPVFCSAWRLWGRSTGKGYVSFSPVWGTRYFAPEIFLKNNFRISWCILTVMKSFEGLVADD